MASLTLFGVNLYNDRVLGSGDPTNVWVALLLTSPTYLSTGATLDEPVGNSYARVQVANNIDQWPESADGLKSNGFDIVFPTATGTWGNIRHWAITTASTGGNIVVYGGLSSRLITDGVTPRFLRDSLSVTINPRA